MEAALKNILSLLNLVEHLKSVLRHSWLSSGRQESVAEHSWRLALMIMLLAPYSQAPINVEKALKMAVIHDLAEAITGDIPIFESHDNQIKQQKILAEQAAMQEMRAILNNDMGEELFMLWQEYENKQSAEAKFVNALDKIEAQLQHNEADLSTWLEREKLMVFQSQWVDRHCEYDEIIRLFNSLVKQQAIAKLVKHGEDIAQLRETALNQIREK
jgi:putative hydrolase of HD superfamily